MRGDCRGYDENRKWWRSLEGCNGEDIVGGTVKTVIVVMGWV